MPFRVLGTRVEWTPESQRPTAGDLLLLPANEHLWMTSGPGLELKKSLGKEIELEAVRQGPAEAGTVVVTSAGSLGYGQLVHAVVSTVDHVWAPGAGEAAVVAAIAHARERGARTLVAWPLYRGVAAADRAVAAKEMMRGFVQGLDGRTRLTVVSVLFADEAEQALLQRTMVQVLGEVT